MIDRQKKKRRAVSPNLKRTQYFISKNFTKQFLKENFISSTFSSSLFILKVHPLKINFYTDYNAIVKEVYCSHSKTFSAFLCQEPLLMWNMLLYLKFCYIYDPLVGRGFEKILFPFLIWSFLNTFSIISIIHEVIIFSKNSQWKRNIWTNQAFFLKTVCILLKFHRNKISFISREFLSWFIF